VNKKIKYVVIIVLLLAFAVSSATATAYWSTVINTGNVVIEVSEQEANLVVVDLNSTANVWLVPEGYDYFVGEVDEVELEYLVSIDKELLKSVNLIVERLVVTIGGSETYSQLVEVIIEDQLNSKTFELFNDTVLIRVRIRLQEPIDMVEAIENGLDHSLVNVEDSQAAYESIKGQEIRIEIGFRVETRT